MKLLRQQIKAGVVRSGTNSRWTALTVQQVKRQIHTFSLPQPFFMYKGPAKSTPVYVNGGASSTLNDGNGGGRGSLLEPFNLSLSQEGPFLLSSDIASSGIVRPLEGRSVGLSLPEQRVQCSSGSSLRISDTLFCTNGFQLLLTPSIQ